MGLWRDDPAGALLGVRIEGEDVVVHDEAGAPVWRYRHERIVTAAGASGPPGAQTALALFDGQMLVAVRCGTGDDQTHVLWSHPCLRDEAPRAIVVRDDLGDDDPGRLAALTIFDDETLYADASGLDALGRAGVRCGDIGSSGAVVLGTESGAVHHGHREDDGWRWHPSLLSAAVDQVQIAVIEGPHRRQRADEVVFALSGGTVWAVGHVVEPQPVMARPGLDLFFFCTYGDLCVARIGEEGLDLVTAREEAGRLTFSGGRIVALTVESAHEEEVLRHQSQAELRVYLEPRPPRDDARWTSVIIDLNRGRGGVSSYRARANVEADLPEWLTLRGEIDRARINDGYRWGDFEEPDDEAAVAALEQKLAEVDDPAALACILQAVHHIERIPSVLRAAHLIAPYLRHRDDDVRTAAKRGLSSLVYAMRWYPANTETHEAGSPREDTADYEKEIAKAIILLEDHRRREDRLGLVGCVTILLVIVALVWWLI